MQSITSKELSILLVEPSDTQRKIIINKLQQQGIDEISPAKSVEEAMAIMQRHPHDLIASAMYFEQGTALDLLRQIRADDKFTDTAFMLVTSEHKREHLEEFKQSGVVALLPKPFTREHLTSAINNTLDLLSVDELELDYFDVHEIRVLLVDDSRLARNHQAGAQ